MIEMVSVLVTVDVEMLDADGMLEDGDATEDSDIVSVLVSVNVDVGPALELPE